MLFLGKQIQERVKNFGWKRSPLIFTLYEEELQMLAWVALALLVAGALTMRLYHLDVPFDRDGYDEGVYWQSLLAMRSGRGLYRPIFYAQPPFFLLSVFPGFILFGGTLWAARLSVALLSLLGLLALYLLGRTLSGRAGGFTALLLLLVSPLYLTGSQTLQAEIPSLAFTLLAVSCAFLWWQRPDGLRGIYLAALTGAMLALSIGCKLSGLSTLVPIALLVAGRIWQIARGQAGTDRKSWLPLLAGPGVALLTLLVLVLPFAGVFAALWSDVVSFHTMAAHVMKGDPGSNYRFIKEATPLSLVVASLYGAMTALLRRDWRVLVLLAWLLASFCFLLRQSPLFYHHMVTLIPPLIALAILGLAPPGAYKGLFPRERFARFHLKIVTFLFPLLACALILRAALPAFHQELDRYAADAARTVSTNADREKDQRVVQALRQAITPNQWVITDAQFLAALASRRVPPWLVDTSYVRIATGYLDLARLQRIAANPRVHAILFYTHRFRLSEVQGFHAWVARHFLLVHVFGVDEYGSLQELWVRQALHSITGDR